MTTDSELATMDASMGEFADTGAILDNHRKRLFRFTALPELRWFYARRSLHSEELFCNRVLAGLDRRYETGVDVTKLQQLSHQYDDLLSVVVSESQRQQLRKLLTGAVAQCEHDAASRIKGLDPTDTAAYTGVRDKWDQLSAIAAKVGYSPQEMREADSTWRDLRRRNFVKDLQTLQPLDCEGFSKLRERRGDSSKSAGVYDEQGDQTLAQAEKEWLDRSLAKLEKDFPLQKPLSAAECRDLLSQSRAIFHVFFGSSAGASARGSVAALTLLDDREYESSIEPFSEHVRQHFQRLIAADVAADPLEEFHQINQLPSDLEQSIYSEKCPGWLPADDNLIYAIKQRCAKLLSAACTQVKELARDQAAKGRYAEAARHLKNFLEGSNKDLIDMQEFQTSDQGVQKMDDLTRGRAIQDHSEVLTIQRAVMEMRALIESIEFLLGVERRGVAPPRS